MKTVLRPMVCLLFFGWVLTPNPCRAESIASLFEDAKNAFWNGQYKEATEKYEKLSSLGVRSVALSYNLGTSYARQGRLGHAVLHYERALRLDPSHADTQYNLNAIREFIARRASEAGRDADLTPAVSAWRAVLDRFSPNSAAVAFLVFYLGLFTVLIARRFIFAELPRLTLGVLIGVLSVLTVATFTISAGKWYQETYTKEAIVLTQNQLDVKEGPQSDVKRLSIEEGSRVTILDERDNWIKLRDVEGRDGWVPAESLGKI